MMNVLERLAAAFQEDGVPLLALKGAALNLTLYPPPHERPMDDLDLLVRPEDLGRARELLILLGAHRGREWLTPDFCPRFHYEEEFFLGDIYPIKIDLHVRPFRPMRYAHFVPPDAFWARAQLIYAGKSRLFVPSVEDMLIHLAAHAAVHGCSRRQWLKDIALWVEAYAKQIDWDRFGSTVEEWRLALPVREALLRTHAVFGLSCPESTVRRLKRGRVSACDRVSLWQAPRDVEHPIAHVLVNTCCTPGWRNRVDYLRVLMGHRWRRVSRAWRDTAVVRWLSTCMTWEQGHGRRLNGKIKCVEAGS